MLRVKSKEDDDGAKPLYIGPAPWIETTPPGVAAQAALERDGRVMSPSCARDIPLVVRRGRGSVVEDVDGNRYLDFAAGLAVCATGHAHPKVVAAVQAQAADLVHGGPDFCCEPVISLAEKLAAIAPGKSSKRVLFTSSGAEAVETAFKLARYHTSRKWVLAFQGSFHGRTMGALALSFSKAQQKAGFEPLVPMVAHVPYGKLDVIKEHIFEQLAAPEEIAAIFVEPVLGEGGYVVPPKNFLPGLRSMCDRHGIVLVCDEIQSGLGRTGKMFACQHFGVVPDVILCAKSLASGLPLGAVVASDTVKTWPPGAQGGTLGGNPVSCAAALATLEALETGLISNAAHLSEVLMGRLAEISARRRCVSKPRGLGLMVAVDVVNRKSGRPDVRMRRRILLEAFRRGLILAACGRAGIRFCPPLCINRTQLSVGLDVFDEVVATVVP
jgi:4-aminobutyrate aminotransferase